jgi:acyl-coenzyme A thioesterase PaaI-like protein
MIRERVLRALAANREPGFHFAGNFCDVAFHRDGDGSRVTVAPGIHNTGPDGHVDFAVLAMVADMALAASIRAGLDPRTRLATVSMTLQMTGVAPAGAIEGRGRFEGFFGGGDSRQGLSRAVLTSDGKPVAFGHGAFMALEPPPGVQLFPLPGPDRPRAAPLAEEDLEPDERELLLRADTILADPRAEGDFLRHFLGFHPRRTKGGSTATMKNGAHVANRVGHVQGGLLAGFAAACANQALPHRWALSAMTACFVSPGQGAVLRASSRVVHHGLMTAVVRTEVIGANRRRVLEALTTHARVVGGGD